MNTISGVLFLKAMTTAAISTSMTIAYWSKSRVVAAGTLDPSEVGGAEGGEYGVSDV